MCCAQKSLRRFNCCNKACPLSVRKIWGDGFKPLCFKHCMAVVVRRTAEFHVSPFKTCVLSWVLRKWRESFMKRRLTWNYERLTFHQHSKSPQTMLQMNACFLSPTCRRGSQTQQNHKNVHSNAICHLPQPDSSRGNPLQCRFDTDIHVCISISSSPLTG